MYSPLFVTLMGIGTVFFGLICIIVLTTIMGSVLKSNAKPAAPAPAAAPKAAAPAAPAVNTAKEFNDRLDFDGVVLTKLDGDTRGGAAISIRAVVKKPLKFISSGEKMDALQVFHPERMADRILGMGDIVSLVEKAQEQYDDCLLYTSPSPRD